MEKFGEKDLAFVKWRLCRHCFKNEWTLVGFLWADVFGYSSILLLKLLSLNLPLNLLRNSISSSNTLLMELIWFVITLSLKRSSLCSGLCISHFLSIVSDFVLREKLTNKEAEHLFPKLQILNDKNDQDTNFAKLSSAKWLFAKLLSLCLCQFLSKEKTLEKCQQIRTT